MTDTWRTLPEGAAAGLSGNVRGEQAETASTRAEGSSEAQIGSEGREADAIMRAVETIKATGGAVEIAGVRIEPCDEFGATETTKRAEQAERAEAELVRLRELVDRQLGDCIGCTTEPDECCPRDGRSYTEWVEIASEVIGRHHATTARAEHAEAELVAASTRFAAALDEQQARLEQARKERRDALAKVARVEAVIAAVEAAAEHDEESAYGASLATVYAALRGDWTPDGGWRT